MSEKMRYRTEEGGKAEIMSDKCALLDRGKV